MTFLPWEYLFQAFSRRNFPDIYDATWIAALVLMAVSIVLYNLRTRALHRHKPYAEMWEWLLWTSVVTYFLIAMGALFLFDFFLVLGTLIVGLGTMVWIRFRRFPPMFEVYEQKLARERFFSKTRYTRPEATIRSRPARRTRRRR